MLVTVPVTRWPLRRSSSCRLLPYTPTAANSRPTIIRIAMAPLLVETVFDEHEARSPRWAVFSTTSADEASAALAGMAEQRLLWPSASGDAPSDSPEGLKP